jgi:DNA-directed RNA polymerase I, II, and III subunit RPABC3
MSAILFDSIFQVKDVNKDGKYFDRVTRFECHSDASDAELVIDINTEIYPMGHDKRFTLVLASTLSTTNAPSTGVYDQSRAPSLLDDYQYAMHGKVFKITEAGGRLTIYVSYGGLLMTLKVNQHDIGSISVDQMVYLLMRSAD